MERQRRMAFKPDIEIPHKNSFHDVVSSLSQRFINGKKLLDIGCWTASFELYLSSRTRTVAIDIEIKALRLAKRFVPRVDFILASATHLPFRNESFDVVTMWQVIEHIPTGNETLVFSEMNNKLTKNGLLFLSTDNNHPIAKCVDPAFFLVDHRHYSQNMLIKLLQQTNFVIKAIFYKGGFIMAFSTILFYIFKHILNRKIPYIHKFEWLKRKELQRKGFILLFMIAMKNKLVKT